MYTTCVLCAIGSKDECQLLNGINQITFSSVVKINNVGPGIWSRSLLNWAVHAPCLQRRVLMFVGDPLSRIINNSTRKQWKKYFASKYNNDLQLIVLYCYVKYFPIRIKLLKLKVTEVSYLHPFNILSLPFDQFLVEVVLCTITEL
jgi:hypothetical protein